LDTGTTDGPAVVGVLEDAVDGAGDGVVALGAGAVLATGVVVAPARLPALAETCTAGDDRGDARKVTLAATAAMTTTSTDAETSNVRRLRAVIPVPRNLPGPEPPLMEHACPVQP
jgi:hypothetical protein